MTSSKKRPQRIKKTRRGADIYSEEERENLEHSNLRGSPPGRHRRFKLDLTIDWWHHPIPTQKVERELLRLAQEDSRRAKNQITKDHHRTGLAIAKKYHGPPKEERVAAAMEGLSKAIRGFNPKNKNGLRAYYETLMRQCLHAEVRHWRRRGDASDTRADRIVFDNRRLTAEQVAAKINGDKLRTPKQWQKDVKSAQEAIDRAASYWHGHRSYDATESNYDDDGNFLGPKADASHEQCYHYDCFSSSYLAPQAKLHNGIRCNGQKDIIRVFHHIGTTLTFWVFGVSPTIDALTIDIDNRADQQLREIGRRGYALKLTREHRRAVVPLFARTPMTYSLPINTARTADDSSGWKDDDARLAALTENLSPLVWSERDKCGGWRRVDLRPKLKLIKQTPHVRHERSDDHDNVRRKPRSTHRRLRSADGNCTRNKSRREG